MLGLRMMPSSRTPAWQQFLRTVSFSAHSVTSAQVSMSWSPSISTSGSTIGTMPPAWQIAA